MLAPGLPRIDQMNELSADGTFYNLGDHSYEALIDPSQTWFQFGFEIRTDGGFDYYRNSGDETPLEFIIGSGPGLATDYMGEQACLVLFGRSYQTVNLLDNICVTPEPGSLALLALGGLALRRR